MNTTKIKIIAMQDYEIPNCPYCGVTPEVVTNWSGDPNSSEYILGREVICQCCGLSAPFNVWEEICGRIEEPVSDEGRSRRRQHE